MIKLFDLSLKLNGYPIEEAKREYQRILDIPEADYAVYVDKKKKEIVQYHYNNNSFYRSLVGDKLPDKWEDLPILTKRDLQRPLKERLSKGFSERKVFINRTSGSSGDPFVFAKDKFCHALTWASIIKRFGDHGINFNTSYQARFYGMPISGRGYFFIRFKDFLSNRYRLSILDFSDEGIEKIVKEFRKRKFTYINGYTSCIVQVAKYLQRKNVVLKDLCPSLQVCVVTSEMLFENDRKLINDSLGVPLLNEYGSAESSVLAIENKHYEWQLNTEDVFVEILDEDNNSLNYGSPGSIVITSLYNKANPFIRYKIGDIGTIQKLSEKKKILKNLEGRTNDFILLPSGRKAAGMTFYSLTKAIMDEKGNIKEFKIVQKEVNKLILQYSCDSELSNEEKEKIRNEFNRYLEPGLVYIFERKDVLERSTSGKLKQFESLISSNFQ